MDASERLAVPSREPKDTILTHLARLLKRENDGGGRLMPPQALGDAGAFPGATAEERYGRIERTAFLAILQVMATLLALAAFRAAHSRIALDTPVMLDIAYQIDHFHRIPYRSLFDMNLPGADLVYVLLGRACGYNHPGGISNAALHVADFVLLSVLAAATWLALRRLSRLVAVAACLLFPLVYLVGGNPDSLQREYVITVLLAVALALAFNASDRHPLLSAWGVGLLLGCCAAIKPPAGLAWLLFAQRFQTPYSCREKWVGITV